MKRILTLLLALTLLFLAACQREPSATPSGSPSPASSKPASQPASEGKDRTGAASSVPSGSSAKSDGVLENVWTGTVYAMPDGWYPYDRATPSYDPATGIVRCLGSGHFEYDDGEEHPYWEYAVFTLTGKSAIPEKFTFTEGLGENESASVACGVFTEDAFWYVRDRSKLGAREESLLVRRDLETGEEITTDCRALFSITDQYLSQMIADRDGDLWLMSMSEVVAVGADLVRLASFPFTDGTDQIAAGVDGLVYAAANTPGGRVLTGMDKATGEKTGSRPLPDRYSEIRFGMGYEYLFTASGGVYGATIGEKGEIAAECVMDYVNSDVTADNVILWDLAGEDALLFRESGDGGADPVIYRPAGTKYMVDMTVLEIAYTYELWDAVYTDAIAKFNKTHDDARIVTLDYSVYSKEMYDPEAARRLTMDMATGVCSPDIILGRPGEEEQIEQLIRKNLYVNLAPYLDADPEVNRDTLLDSVLTAFDDGGEIWGLANYWYFDALVGNRAILDACGMAGKESWTLGELLDFASRLPDGVELMEDLTQENAGRKILGNYGLGAFFDEEAGSCAFDGDDFVRYLEFLGDLPKNEAELKRRSPLASAQGAERYDYLMTGKVALAPFGAFDAQEMSRLEGAFGTKDWVLIGYPAEDGRGVEANSQTACCITSFCSDPDLAWEFVRSVVLSTKNASWGMTLLPVLKDRLVRSMKGMTDADIVQYFSGHTDWSTPKSDPPLTKADLREPGLIIDFTMEDAERIGGELDKPGLRIAKMIPAAINEIVNEEISAYLAGHGTAKDCAGKIQSRAGIWLAEHK